jgi:hypothetical protein
MRGEQRISCTLHTLGSSWPHRSRVEGEADGPRQIRREESHSCFASRLPKYWVGVLPSVILNMDVKALGVL